ncbi:MAG TPA: PIG-L family deacetylase [Kofleriaceae bacterium]
MRIAIVAAHPDDETIGASALMAANDDILVVHVTDGAPRSSRWWPAGWTDRDAYARERDHEARRALTIVGAARTALGFEDQATVFVLGELVAALSRELARWQPDAIVSHAYEGGHPDHDAVACAVAHAAASVPVFEMALYHGATGALCAGEFLGPPLGLRHVLTAPQRERKRAMLAQYRSQQATLSPFLELAHECYRRAPAYDFSRPPHGGPLQYERWDMAPTGARWRAAASRWIASRPRAGAGSVR